ncbi:MAG: ROK family protein [Chitinophagales bacterium]|nr:ROK family protein [Chitinophagales bacterium]
MNDRIVAGIDIGGTNTKYGLVNEYGKILMNGSIHTAEYQEPQEFAAELCKLIRNAAAKINNGIHGIGIGSPNGNYYTGMVELAPNLPWKGMIPLAKYFMDEINLPVVLTNDAKAAALGEMVFGGARNMKHFIFITLGTGLGSGIVCNGSMVYGHDGFAGEMGHTIVKEGSNRLCGCGRYGCLEQYASASGIRISYMKFLAEKGMQAPVEPDKIDSQYIFKRAQENDKEALAAFHYTGHILGLAIANAVTYFSPEAIFLFGGLTRAGDFIFKPTIESFEKNLLKIYAGKTKILPSSLQESDAAILGAASLIWNELKKFS